MGPVLYRDSATIYVAGDTEVFADVALIKRVHAPDLAVRNRC